MLADDMIDRSAARRTSNAATVAAKRPEECAVAWAGMQAVAETALLQP